MGEPVQEPPTPPGWGRYGGKPGTNYHPWVGASLTAGAQAGSTKRTRAAIPKSVKRGVWKRDGGRCRKCGITDAEAMSRDGEHLHLDHIHPWSLNGADTADNLQLLCGRCNREKGDRIKSAWQPRHSDVAPRVLPKLGDQPALGPRDPLTTYGPRVERPERARERPREEQSWGWYEFRRRDKS